jgi:hypothetical protein
MENKPTFFKGIVSDGKGNYSSRRFAFLVSTFAIIGFVIFMIIKYENNADILQEVITNYMIYSAFLGGVVSIDSLDKITSIFSKKKIATATKNKNDK